MLHREAGEWDCPPESPVEGVVNVMGAKEWKR
jgi:hypothetical protein